MADRSDEPGGLSRRELLQAGAAVGAGLALGSAEARAASDTSVVRLLDFSKPPQGSGWGPGWSCPGVANLRIAEGAGLLEAGSDVFPDDPRPVAFAIDCRLTDATVRAAIARPGSMAGVVLRRTSPRDYYAAVYDAEQSQLAIVRRSGADLITLAQAPAPAGAGEMALALTATGTRPTTLTASLTGAGGATYVVSARDADPPCQRAGDPGVLARARTLFPSAGPAVLPALGNLHLLPYGIQEGQAFIDSFAGQAVIGEIRRQSTAAFTQIVVASAEAPQKTAASVIAATTGLPGAGGARLHVAADVPADLVIEVSGDATFSRPRRLPTVATGAFDAATVRVRDLPAGERAYWRPTLRRAGTKAVGPVRSFPVLPAAGAPAGARIAVVACGTQFGPIFDHIARADPDVFVWQGDLNYPDTHGPLAQTTTGYAGIWRDFLANPRLAPMLERLAFVAMRDDHDYAAQDSNSTTIPRFPWGIGPWDALMGAGAGYRFSAGLADVWVLDQRRFKSDPEKPDDPRKTLLGEAQKRWLFDGLAESDAPFKVICSPCTVFMPFNARDGNWAAGFTNERDQLLAHIDSAVSGRTIFITGDTHFTGVYDDGRRYEARAAPVDIPVPNDITLSDPLAVPTLRGKPGIAYADERGHAALLEVGGHRDTATLTVTLLRQDGARPHRQVFTQPIQPPVLRAAIADTDRSAVSTTRRLRVRITLGEPGRVRLRATLTRLRAGRRTTVRLADRVVRFTRAGRRTITLRPTRRSLAELRKAGRVRLSLSARHRSPAGRVVRTTVRRWLRGGR